MVHKFICPTRPLEVIFHGCSEFSGDSPMGLVMACCDVLQGIVTKAVLCPFRTDERWSDPAPAGGILFFTPLIIMSVSHIFQTLLLFLLFLLRN